ncbi:MAG: hypothetical protein ACOYVD_15210 [Bacillota bacterium]
MNLIYPQWYRVEKEAAIIINRINNFNDLTFYLHNSNHHIRRMAILRLGELLPKEAVNDLEQILNNPQEVMENKELSAWVLQKISIQQGIDLFITNPLITKYSGEENLKERYTVKLKEPFNNLHFSFSHSLLDEDLSVEEDYLLRNQETDFDAPFSLKEWRICWQENLIKTVVIFFKNLPVRLLEFLKKILFFLWQHLISKFLNYMYNKSSRYYFNNRERFNPLSILKNTGFFLLYALLFPVRLLRRNKLSFFVITMTILFFLVYTSTGQSLIITYLGDDFWSLQNKNMVAVKEIITATWAEVGNVTSILIKKVQASATWQTAKEYVDLVLSFKNN